MNKHYSKSAPFFTCKPIALAFLALSLLAACSPGVVPYLGKPQREVFDPSASASPSVSPSASSEPILDPIEILDPNTLYIARVSPRWTAAGGQVLLQGAALDRIGTREEIQLVWYNWNTKASLAVEILEQNASTIILRSPAAAVEQDVSLQLLQSGRILQSFPVMVQAVQATPSPESTPSAESSSSPAAEVSASPEVSPEPTASPNESPAASPTAEVSASPEPSVSPSPGESGEMPV